MTDSPRFSVVTINYQNAEGLAATGESVRIQTFADFEWIVVDGASTDGSVEVATSCSIARKIVTSERDNGIFDAMEKGLQRSSGDYVIFMNSGDRFAGPHVLQTVHEAIGSETPDLVYGDAYEEDAAGRYYKPARGVDANRYAMFTHHQAQFYRTDSARAVGGFDNSYVLSGDWVLTTRVLRHGRAHGVSTPICIFARGGLSQQGRTRQIMNRELFRIYRTEHRHGLLKSAVLWSIKVGVNKARLMAPRAYDLIRYRKRLSAH